MVQGRMDRDVQPSEKYFEILFTLRSDQDWIDPRPHLVDSLNTRIAQIPFDTMVAVVS